MKKFLLDLVVDPITQSSLVLDSKSNCLTNGKGTYQIKSNVPIILPHGIEEVNSVASSHLKERTSFRYTDHYEKDAAFFDYFKDHEFGPTRHEIERLKQAIIKEVDKSFELILDVGSGNSWVARHFVHLQKKIISMDISTINPIRAVRDIDYENHAGLVADVYNPPFLNNSIDCIIASEIMEHLPDPAGFISKMYSILKPGGKLIITTPYNEQIEYNLCIHCNRPTPRNAHLHSFEENSLTQMLNNCAINNFQFKLLNNSYLVKIRSHKIFEGLPFSVWEFFDTLANKFFFKPMRIITLVKK